MESIRLLQQMSQVCEYVYSVFTLLSFSEFNFKNVFATVLIVLDLPCTITSCHTFSQIENFIQILSKQTPDDLPVAMYNFSPSYWPLLCDYTN